MDFDSALNKLSNNLSAFTLGGKECLKSAWHPVRVSPSLSLPNSRPRSSCPGLSCWLDCWWHPQQQHLPVSLPAAEKQLALPGRPADSQPFLSPPSTGYYHREAAGETGGWGPGAGTPPVPPVDAAFCTAQLPSPQAEDGAVCLWCGLERCSFWLQVSG